MSNIKHTPTPWNSYEGYDATVIRTTYRKTNQITPRAVAEVTHHGAFHEPNGERTQYHQATAEDRANTAFIVRACNAHDALVEAAQAQLLAMRAEYDAEAQAAILDMGWRNMQKLTANEFAECLLRAALNLATGE